MALWSPELYALGLPPNWAACILLLWQADYCGQSGGHSWPLVYLVAKPCLVRRLLATGGQGWDTRLLAAGPQGVLRLVLAHWQAKPSCGGVCCGTSVPGSSVHLADGLRQFLTLWVTSVPKLVLPFW